MSAVNVTFSQAHVNETLGPLTVTTGADEITWGYGLNTKTFPTYGGEVVQILSAYTTDLTITGTVRSYRQIEAIYTWFLSYLQFATQSGGFDQTPVTFEYSHRDWHLHIMPKRLPQFHYGRDVVAPVWRMEAAVIEGDRKMNDALKWLVQTTGIDTTQFNRVTGDIGYIEDNPFSSPFGGDSDANAKTKETLGELGDYYTKLIDSYANGDFEDLHADYSKPAFLANEGTALPGNNTGIATDDNGRGTVETP